jgi:DNA-binding CsgD family transcriptional regulator
MDRVWADLERLNLAKDMAAADSVFRELLGEFGVTTFAYLGLNLGPRRKAPLLISTYAQEWCERYLDRRYYGLDPVILGARKRSLCFDWGDRDYLASLSEAQRLFFLEARDFGIACGVTYPIHGAQQQFAVVSLVSEKPLDLDLHAQNLLQLATLHYHVRHVANADDDPSRNHIELTPREAECLTWAANGKSAWEIGQILRLSRYTVQEHIESAKRKLDCRSRDHAVVKAVMEGLITP